MCVFLSPFLSPSSSVYGQSTSQKQKTKIRIVHAGSLKFDENKGNGAKRLIGDVQFKHDNILLFCDSAYFYNNNSMDAYGNVHIKQNDSTHLYGDSLKYFGNTKHATFKGNVLLEQGKLQLTTDTLHYDITNSTGYYTTFGKVVNENDILTSNLGYYYAKTSDIYFKKNVVVLHRNKKTDSMPELTINSDTMRYNRLSKINNFYGPTNIYGEQSHIYCEDGEYNTQTKLAKFSDNSYLINSQYKMIGDSLFYDGKSQIATAVNNVKIIDTIENSSIHGKIALHYEQSELSVVTGQALLKKVMETDTLFLHADTLKALGGSSSEKNHQVLAYYKVKFYKNNLQGKCDSINYNISDSVMNLYGAPTLWSNQNQLSADSISLFFGDSTLNSIDLFGNSFIVSEEKDSTLFSQIRGKRMIGTIVNNELRTINVKGNGQTIYFVEDDGDIEAVNQAICSDIDIYLADNKIEKIVFLTRPDATLHPINQVIKDELFLKGFTWRKHLRPTSSKDVFNWRK